jgi:hypothetical protein
LGIHAYRRAANLLNRNPFNFSCTFRLRAQYVLRIQLPGYRLHVVQTVPLVHSYGIGTEDALEAPNSLLAVILKDWSRCTRSSVVLPFDRTKGIAIRTAPPTVWDVAL